MSDDSTDAPGPQHHEIPKIDVSKALHEAGHEVEELGFESIPDTGPVIHAAEAKIERDENDMDPMTTVMGSD